MHTPAFERLEIRRNAAVSVLVKQTGPAIAFELSPCCVASRNAAFEQLSFKVLSQRFSSPRIGRNLGKRIGIRTVFCIPIPYPSGPTLGAGVSPVGMF